MYNPDYISKRKTLNMQAMHFSCWTIIFHYGWDHFPGILWKKNLFGFILMKLWITINYGVLGDFCIIERALCKTLSVRLICFRLNNSISSLCCTIWCFQYYKSGVILVVVMVLFCFLTDNRTTIGLFCIVAIIHNKCTLYNDHPVVPVDIGKHVHICFMIWVTFHKSCLGLSNWYWFYY